MLPGAVNLGVTPMELSAMTAQAKYRTACTSWALEGFGVPAVHGYYVIKAIVYLLGFWLCQRRHAGHTGFTKLFLKDMTFRQDAFRRLVLYNLLFEVLGFGCGSGPLTARFLPPHTAWFHFLCPGTIKLPFRMNSRDSRRSLVPWLSTRRTKFDVALFVGYLYSLVRMMLAPQVTAAGCRVVCAFLSALALVDHTVFLASRGEVYGYMAVAFCSRASSLQGAQLIQLGIYFWAAISKLGPWFANVIQVMLSNSPCWPHACRSLLYRDLQKGDFRASAVAKRLAGLGTSMELAIPLLLPKGGLSSRLGLFLSVSMHTFIFTNFAMGCPQ